MSSFLNGLDWIVTEGNNLLWSYVLIVMLVGTGVYFTVRTKFVQVRLFGEMFRLVTDKKEGDKGISAFQAFTISSATRIGTGNITGVALAIAIGGPGAVFWMWLIALIGMATALIESTLAQVYKVKDGDQFRGGPAYYIQLALGNRPVGILFAILTILSFGLVINGVQANTIAASFSSAFNVPTWAVGSALVILTAAIIFGGVKRIAQVTQVVVPVMAVMYVGVALFVIVTNITEIPGVIALIVKSALGIEEVAGATVGAAIMQGVRRGLFSNEAGMGSAPHAAATANVSHPVKQGLVQSLGVFIDTIVVCSATAFIIILAGLYNTGEHEGILLTQASLGVHVGSWAPYFLAVSIFFFAFSSVIGCYYYGETNIEFIKASNTWLTIYRFAALGMVMFGSVAQVALIWNMADLFMGLVSFLNLIVILVLGRVAFQVLDDYDAQRRAGKDPQFYAKNIPGLKNAPTWGNER